MSCQIGEIIGGVGPAKGLLETGGFLNFASLSVSPKTSVDRQISIANFRTVCVPCRGVSHDEVGNGEPGCDFIVCTTEHVPIDTTDVGQFSAVNCFLPCLRSRCET